MKKWYQQTLQIPMTPDNTVVDIVCYYDNELENVHNISIELSVTNSDGVINYIIYSHVAKTIAKQDPSIEDIYNRYSTMLNKYINLYNGINFDLINFNKFKKYSPEAPSL